MGRALGYDDLEGTEVSHSGVDLLRLTGRTNGFVSPILAGKYLRGITSVVVSDGFWKKAYRESVLLGFDVGLGSYVVGEGKMMLNEFMNINGRIIRESEYR